MNCFIKKFNNGSLNDFVLLYYSTSCIATGSYTIDVGRTSLYSFLDHGHEPIFPFSFTIPSDDDIKLFFCER